MPSSHNGNPANGSWLPAISVTEPADGDAVTAASVNTAITKLADYVAFFQANSARVNPLNNAIITATTDPTSDSDFQCFLEVVADGTHAVYIRGYRTTAALIFTYNAKWVTASSHWISDYSTNSSVELIMGDSSGDGIGGLAMHAPTGGSWSAASWTGAGFGAGILQADVARSSSTVGSGQGVSLGNIYKDTTVVAWAKVDASGNLIKGANISTCVKGSGSGNYEIVLVNKPTVTAPTVTSNDVSQLSVFRAYESAGTIYVKSLDLVGAGTDAAFTLVVFGG